MLETKVNIFMCFVTFPAYKDYKLGRDSTEISRTVVSRSIFQSVASMALPAFTIHQTVHFTHKYIFKAGRYQVVLKLNALNIRNGDLPLLDF